MNGSCDARGGDPLIRTVVQSLCTDPGTHSIINSVDKHGINPPVVLNLNEAFIEILGPVSDFAAKASGDVGSGGEAGTRAALNAKSEERAGLWPRTGPPSEPSVNYPQDPAPARRPRPRGVPRFQVVLRGRGAKS